MKKTVTAILGMLLCASAGTQAQITSGNWYDGTIIYSASPQAGGRVVMNAMDEGEEHEFVLVPVAGKADTYRVTNGPNDYVNKYYDIATVRHMKKEGWDVICYYNKDNHLRNVMSKESTWNADQINKSKWLSQIIGKYSSADGRTYDWGFEVVTVNGTEVPFRVVQFNGRVTGYITIDEDGGTGMKGTWEIVPTLGGLQLYAINSDGEYLYDWKREGRQFGLTWDNRLTGRFSYAGTTLLNDKKFQIYDKATLRIMRNAILARHGYRFQSKDLQDYFAGEPWYRPAASNDGIKVSFVEQLNIDLIKAEEAKRAQ